MMNIEKIIIANNGIEIRITEMNNGQVVRDGIYRTAEFVNLIDNDYTIDYKTIAGLLCMTEEEFKRDYKLGRTESEREDRVCGADWILTYAEFTKKDEFDILLEAIQNGDIDITDDEPEEDEETVIEVPKEEPVMVPNNNMVIAKIQEQMIKAIEESDFETYDKLEERLNRLNK